MLKWIRYMLWLKTEEAIAKYMVKQLSASEKHYLVADLRFRYSLAREIRNSFGLWHCHPLTARWREHGPSDLKDKVDHSYDHPDAVSARIVNLMLKLLS